MAVLKLIFIVCAFRACANSEESTTKLSKNSTAAPGASVEVKPRFFDLGGIINQLFGGLNQGNQGAPGYNSPAMDLPANLPYYPNTPIQGQDPQIQTGQGGTWPVIDDASQYPNRRPGPSYPDQRNNGRYPPVGNSMYPNESGMGGAFPVTHGAGLNTQVPPQSGLNRPPLTQFPQNPSQGNFMNPNPGQGNNMNQYPSPAAPMPLPQDPIDRPIQNQYPNQGDWNQNNFMPAGPGGDGTLDGIIPPNNPWNPDIPNDFQPDGIDGNTPISPDYPADQYFPAVAQPGMPDGGLNGAIGRDVVVPMTTPEPGRIFFPSSTENPSLKRCVQDCQTSTEYNPVCGSDDVTYINPGKFVCARNCGVNVFVVQTGRCPGTIK